MEEKKTNSRDNLSPAAANPYKGLYSYEECDKDRFYGRDTEKKELFRLVKYNFLTVVFGKSGIGKTSLLNAGLFPQLRSDGFLPIKIHLDYSEEAPELVDQVKRQIQEELDKNKIQEKEGDKTVKGFSPGETLWEYFHRVRHYDGTVNNKLVTPVLVIDQFEEMFTVGKNHPLIDAWTDELYYLLEDQFPPQFRNRVLEEQKEFSKSYLKETPNLRVVISLREDYLPSLNSLKSRIASIDRAMFRVVHLNGKQAREIIGMPGGIQDKKVTEDILSLFYPKEVDKSKKIPDEKLEIEPYILSILCFQLIEEKSTELITKKDQDRILKDFYDSVMKKFPVAVEKFIETKLLTEGGYRTPFYLERDHHLKHFINRLADGRVLRKIHYGEKEHIEIIHDVLTPIIKEKRSRRSKKTKSIIISGLVIFMLSLVLLVGYAFYQQNSADRQYNRSLVNSFIIESIYTLREDENKSLRFAEEAYRIGYHHPPRLMQVLSEAAFSNSRYPFYNVSMEHAGPISSANFSPFDKRILTASDDGTAKLWDWQGNFLQEFKHTKPVVSAVFSPYGTKVLTASQDNTAKLWDLKGEHLADFKDHTHFVNSVVFSPYYTPILTASWDNSIKLWNSTGTCLVDINDDIYIGWRAVFSPDGKYILAALWDNTAKLWDLRGNLLQIFKGHSGVIYSAVFSPDGKSILTASQDGTAKLWNMEGGLLTELSKHTKSVYSALFSPDGTRIVTASADGTAKLWDLQGNMLEDFDRHTEVVKSAVFSPDGKRVLTASEDGTAKLWDLHGNLLSDLNNHTGPVNSAIFSPDGNLMLTASADGTAKLWYTPEAIIEWLKTANIPALSKEDKVKPGIK